ncbi:tetratricopeptide repeat protein [Hyphococcus luteus]|nr:tetratricopeptide repeat protein [Marinicaulis flavus]
MAAHPLGVIVGGVSCLGVGAAVVTVASGPGAGVEAPAAEEASASEVYSIEERYKELDELRLGCAKGEGEACFELGRAHETREDLWGQQVKGEGVRRDDRKAARYFRLSCKAGVKEGCRRLGRMYEAGKGVAEDRAAAARFYHKACGLRDGGGCKDWGGASAGE